jgi:uncharacterized SAM-binding protein YcdF (DUF218 family)
MIFLNNDSISIIGQKLFSIFVLIIFLLVFVVFMSVPLLNHFLVINKPLPHAEAIVVMAGNKSERLPAAVLLYKEGKAPKIFLTNDGVFSAFSKEKQRNLYQVEWAENELIRMGIPADAIVKLGYTKSGTIFDAVNVRKSILDTGIKSIIIVTSDYHTRRSYWALKKVLKGYSIQIGVYPVESNQKSDHFISKAIKLYLELLKYLYYRCEYRNY